MLPRLWKKLCTLVYLIWCKNWTKVSAFSSNWKDICVYSNIFNYQAFELSGSRNLHFLSHVRNHLFWYLMSRFSWFLQLMLGNNSKMSLQPSKFQIMGQIFHLISSFESRKCKSHINQCILVVFQTCSVFVGCTHFCWFFTERLYSIKYTESRLKV